MILTYLFEALGWILFFLTVLAVVSIPGYVLLGIIEALNKEDNGKEM